MMQRVKFMFWEKKSQLELWIHSLHINSVDVIRYASCFGVGFLGGILFKRWSKYIILLAVFLAVALAILQGFAIITINFGIIQKLTGIQNITNIQALFIALKDITQVYACELSFSGIGFIIGFKTG